jgi:hypothetical protein
MSDVDAHRISGAYQECVTREEGWGVVANCTQYYSACRLLHYIIINSYRWLRPTGEQQLICAVPVLSLVLNLDVHDAFQDHP